MSDAKVNKFKERINEIDFIAKSSKVDKGLDVSDLPISKKTGKPISLAHKFRAGAFQKGNDNWKGEIGKEKLPMPKAIKKVKADLGKALNKIQSLGDTSDIAVTVLNEVLRVMKRTQNSNTKLAAAKIVLPYLTPPKKDENANEAKSINVNIVAFNGIAKKGTNEVLNIEEAQVKFIKDNVQEIENFNDENLLGEGDLDEEI